MNKLSNNIKLLITCFFSILIISYTAIIVPSRIERNNFFQMYILGTNRMAGQYYPENNPNLTMGIKMSWHLFVSNDMGSAQSIMLKVKLGNMTSPAPDQIRCEPASLQSLVEFRKVLQDKETWAIPFNWSVVNVEETQEMIYLRNINVNNLDLKTSTVCALHGYNFRMIFELWTFNSTTREYQFGWFSNGRRDCAWLQIWFNATRNTI